MAKRTKNPLNKRLPRELKGELGKYLVIFLFLSCPSPLSPDFWWQTTV